VIQKRYLPGCPSEVLVGDLPESVVAIENGLRYKLNLLNNRNSGFFPDMKLGREFVASNCAGKKVLNLFAYTCSFSVVAIDAGAKEVVNVDMSKGALTVGRENHHLNQLSTRQVTFMPYNILKSWGRIKKAGPYDLIVIDPPTFQKGSFAASRDYQKIVRRLSDLANDSCLVLAALNSPDLESTFVKDIFKEHAPDFKFEYRLPEMSSFPSKNSERALKNLVFRYHIDNFRE
jgi:23S rRNA (cytosine1962-C5)-methyltransferase